MASGISSLFGPSAEELMYAQQQENVKRQQQQLQQGLAVQSSPLAQQFYQSGYNIASGLGGLFGSTPMVDPRLARSIKSRQIMSDISVEDLNDPNKLNTLAKEFAEAKMPEATLYFADRASALRKQESDYQLELRKLEADSGMSPTTFNQFMDQLKDDFKGKAQEKFKTVELGYEYYNQAMGHGVGTKKSSTAERLLNRELIKLSEDSQIGLTEIQNLVGGGDIGTKVANVFSELLEGTQSVGKLKEKLRLLQALEGLEAEKYNEKVDSYRLMYSGLIDPFRLNEALKYHELSPQAEEYLTMREEAAGLGNSERTINVEDAEVLDFLGGGPV